MTSVSLSLSGMTCATCAGRIERSLNSVPGAKATVNFATERATVTMEGVVDATQLVAAVVSAGYGATVIEDTAAVASSVDEPSAVEDLRVLRNRVVVSAVLGVPVILISMIPSWQFDGWQWALLNLTTPIATWAAWPFHRAAWNNARHGATTMDTLVSLGVAVAYLSSLVALLFTGAGQAGMHMDMPLFGSPGDAHTIYFESAAAVTLFLLAGRYLEMMSKRDARRALRALMELGAKDVILLMGDREVTVPIAALSVGDRFVVLPGSIVAADGVVVSGTSSVDASMVTGESVPVDVSPTDRVIGGTIVVGGRIVVEATGVGADSQLARMTRMVEDAQAGKAKVQHLADRVSSVFVPAVIVISVVGFVLWWWGSGDVTIAVQVAVATLVIACPCALGLATPMALLVGSGVGAKWGILIRGTDALENTRRIDTVVLDKTGTLTTGRLSVTRFVPISGTEAQLLSAATSVERASEHPLAQAIVREAKNRELSAPVASDTVPVVAQGISGTVDGLTVRVGKLQWLSDSGVDVTSEARTRFDELVGDTATVVAVSSDAVLLGFICLADTVKPTTVRAIEELQAAGLTPILLTGDNAAVADAIAREVGIATVYSQVSPADKLRVIRELQSQGKTVAMVGDGVNDAAALAASDLGIAMGHGTDVAREASDITVVSGDLRLVAAAIRLSRATLGTIKGNLVWAFAYNAVAIPIALAGLLSPVIAGLAMAFSSIFVVLNSARLRGFRPGI